ncbi:cytochrome-b5 reductase [Saccharomycopsis crataegensis]|uniref:NADH-cytochrome b5 reductase n=1 Tax=Saccharomycopsis crataegensis TaxID=43959 RepID=A0AAV5QES5_9ASCO|nr:cytochrome-b5 reductase [Saccharomycopsis crataegensis]
MAVSKTSSKLLYLTALAGATGALYYFSKSRVPVPAPKAFTDSSAWIDLKLKSFKDLSHDSREFVFELPSANHVSGLETASLVLGKYMTAKGNPVIRPYTPISDNDQKGEITFVIKKYPNSKFGTHVFGLKPNDSVSFKGPIQKWKWVPNSFDSVTLIGGGSGITPLYQILSTVAKNPEDNTKVHLIYGSQTPADILLKSEIDALAKKYPEQVKVDYFVDKAEGEFEGHVGFVSKEFLEKSIPKSTEKTQAFVCGPAGLYKAVSGTKASKTDQGEVTGALAELGYTKENVFKF